MRIEFGDLRLGDPALQNLLQVVKTNWASGGPLVKQLEEKWGKLFGYKHNIAVSSGTSADTVACMALYQYGAKPYSGDEIIAPACAFAAVGESILMAGFKPVFVDIKRETLNIDVSKVEAAITPKTRAIMAVHTMGKPCEMEVIMALAKKYNLKVIEDSCEAHGAKYKGKMIGHWGDMATFSAYVAHLICCGEGGMISTNDPELASLCDSIRSHGRKPGSLYFDHERLGLNAKMNDMEAAIGLPQIDTFWDTFNKRRDNLLYLLDRTKDLEKYAHFIVESPEEIVCPHAFSVTLKDPSYNALLLTRYLEENSIKTKRNFGSMPTQHKSFSFLGHTLGQFPEAEYVGDNGVHFGIHQYLNREDVEYISLVLHNYFKKF
ncbi:MAG TPA: DegT/DnrJ/EryC1/StrS family aminotransferase [Candidatus Nanoarchaeia archaeon]|nr:DegT/DnrJ/EryC1/StrS family aminotransferase [Candidatus Nanoarchaeia archaeon]